MEDNKQMAVCQGCGKILTHVEIMVGQCNECDPFDEDLDEVFGDPQYTLM